MFNSEYFINWKIVHLQLFYEPRIASVCAMSQKNIKIPFVHQNCGHIFNQVFDRTFVLFKIFSILDICYVKYLNLGNSKINY